MLVSGGMSSLVQLVLQAGQRLRLCGIPCCRQIWQYLHVDPEFLRCCGIFDMSNCGWKSIYSVSSSTSDVVVFVLLTSLTLFCSVVVFSSDGVFSFVSSWIVSDSVCLFAVVQHLSSVLILGQHIVRQVAQHPSWINTIPIPIAAITPIV